MKGRKLVILVLLLTVSVIVLNGCAGPAGLGGSSGSSQAGKPKVTLWTTGSDNLRVLFEKAIEVYNAKPESKSVVELQFIMSGTGDQALSDRLAAAKLANQKDTDFDLIAENGSSLSAYVDKAGGDLFVPLDFSKIPNYKNVLMKSGFYTECVVPYRGTTVVMAYDSDVCQILRRPLKNWMPGSKPIPASLPTIHRALAVPAALLSTGLCTEPFPWRPILPPMKNGLPNGKPAGTGLKKSILTCTSQEEKPFIRIRTREP